MPDKKTPIKKYGKVWIGTSNIVLPGTKNTFPRAFQTRSRLSYYASLFNTVEINSSFYKPPMPATFEKWSAEVPAGFKFTVKLWRNITHAKGLAFNLPDIDFFMNAANRVSNAKKGCLLIQFPASIGISFIDKVETLLQRLQENDPQDGWSRCVEFRNPGWYTGDAYSMLDHYNASLVLHDMPASALSVLQTKTGLAYLRFHGLKGDYKGSYDQGLLRKSALTIKNWTKKGKNVYVYFNNTIGNAFENAQSLQDLL